MDGYHTIDYKQAKSYFTKARCPILHRIDQCEVLLSVITQPPQNKAEDAQTNPYQIKFYTFDFTDQSLTEQQIVITLDQVPSSDSPEINQTILASQGSQLVLQVWYAG